jgi:hypothetical protein
MFVVALRVGMPHAIDRENGSNSFDVVSAYEKTAMETAGGTALRRNGEGTQGPRGRAKDGVEAAVIAASAS